MKTYRISRINSVNEKTILMSGLPETQEGFRFRPMFELKVLCSDQKTYHNAICDEVDEASMSFHTFYPIDQPVCGGNIFHTYLIEEETAEDIRKSGEYFVAKSHCKTCMGTGSVNHNGSNYKCSHGLSEDQLSFNGMKY
jgi:hypothetical protein